MAKGKKRESANSARARNPRRVRSPDRSPSKEPHRPVTTVGIAIKRGSVEASNYARTLARWLVQQKKLVYIEHNRDFSKGDLKHPLVHVVSKTALVRRADVIVVLGGDGTLIRMARETLYANRMVPLVGINLGTLGFLSNVAKDHTLKLLEGVFRGKYFEDRRATLEVRLIERGGRQKRFFVLNDVVINKADIARMIELEVLIDNKYIATFRADGVIVATPTGSTAYSLAAGGPIVSPNVHGFVITPICPQFFGHQALVVSDVRSIVLKLGPRNPKKIFLSLDGQTGQAISVNHRIEIRRAERDVILLKAEPFDFFETLRSKLKWTLQSHAQGTEP